MLLVGNPMLLLNKPAFAQNRHFDSTIEFMDTLLETPLVDLLEIFMREQSEFV